MNQLNNYENPGAGSVPQEMSPELMAGAYVDVVRGALDLLSYQRSIAANGTYENA